MGSALLQDPERASRILKTLSTEVPRPVSCKIRLVKDTASTLDLLTALIDRGQAQAVAIHGRRVGDPEIKPSQRDDLAEVLQLARSKFPHTRFLVNGDFYTRQEWYDFRDQTGADGVLWARPALYNCSIFRKPPPQQTPPLENISSVQYGYQSPLLLDRTTVIQDYLKQSIRYQTHYKNVKYVVAEMMNTRRTPTPRVPFLTPPQEAFVEGGQTIGLTSACHDLDSLCALWKVDRQAVEASRNQTASTISNDSTTPTPTEGEHRYEDSYLLRMEESTSNTTNSFEDKDQPAAKRARTTEQSVES